MKLSTFPLILAVVNCYWCLEDLDFHLPTVVGKNLTIEAIKSGYQLTLLNVSCLPVTSFYWATATDESNIETQGEFVTQNCTKTTPINVTLFIRKLDFDSTYSLILRASSKSTGIKTVAVTGAIPPMITVPSIEPKLTDTTDHSVTLNWNVSKDDCVTDPIYFNISAFYTQDKDVITPVNTTIKRDVCLQAKPVTTQISLKPYRVVNITAKTCNQQGKCGGVTTFVVSTKASGANVLDKEKISVAFGTDNLISASVEFDRENCTGPTKFLFTLKLLRGPDSSDMDVTLKKVSKNASQECPVSTESIKMDLGNWHAYRYYQLTITPSTHISSAKPTDTFHHTETNAQGQLQDFTAIPDGITSVNTSWTFTNSLCYGPTQFNISYKSSDGVERHQIHNSTDYPNCPLTSESSVEFAVVNGLEPDTQYVFYVTPFTDKGTEAIQAEVPVRTGKDSSKVSWYKVVLPIAAILSVVGGISCWVWRRKKAINYSRPLVTPEIYD